MNISGTKNIFNGTKILLVYYFSSTKNNICPIIVIISETKSQ